MKYLAFILAAVGLAASVHARAPQPTAEQQARLREILAIEKSLHPETGDIPLPTANALLHLGKEYYYLPPADARKVIVDLWGNPPSVAEGNLGMIFLAGKHAYDDTWGAVLTYDPMGYVGDDDARTADYDEMLAEIQSGEQDLNARRREQGYPAQHLVGWAQPPSYDAGDHSVIWAQNLAFEGQPVNSLNYDVRLLGRYGVLSLNMVTVMPQLGETRVAARKLASSAQFIPGSRYADFQPGTDTKADVGIAGLVAAGVGVVAAKKLGLLALLAVFAKKFLVLILAGFGLIAARFRAWFGRGKSEEAEDESWQETSAEFEEDAQASSPEEPGTPLQQP